MQCLLCGSETKLFFTYEARLGQQYYQCSGCSSVQLHPDFYVTREEEKARYLTHNNDVHDPGYRKFVSPIVNGILEDYEPSHKGLDFGSGTGPVIAKMLRDRSYSITTYDPFFSPDEDALNSTYDYIACCEVAEHFHQPKEEFTRLKHLLRPGGSLYLKTDLYDATIDFAGWRYKDDETHTFIYHADAFRWIKEKVGFSELKIMPDLIVLRK